ncbi:M28 family metallopeptidase [Actinomycetospora sp. CA-053990]|uniref:M28 family metallopeptidase n=1 Tax=Actinomycetospora sp. CA-053990 TaxID=3239891 RepID=UPI003D8F384E
MSGLCGRVLAAVIASLVMTGCASGSRQAPAAGEGGPVGGGPLAERLATEATVDGAVGHLEALQAIADRNGGNRAVGTPGYDQSVEYVASTLSRAGFRVETPTIAVTGEDDEHEGAAGARATRSVIAQTTTGRTDEVVLSGAHLDSVPEGPGINDDGSGVAANLEIALRLGAAAPVTNAVRFVWFGAEEEGLVGSQQYMQGLSADRRRDIALMLNSDMIASLNAGYFVYDGDGSDPGSTEDAAAGSPTIERLLVDRLASLGVPAQGIRFSGDSDYGPFVEAAIPSGGVFSGDAPSKTPEQAALWGGRAGVPFDPCYHRACDTTSNIDRVAYGRMLNALAFGIGSFATDLGGLPPRAERG